MRARRYALLIVLLAAGVVIVATTQFERDHRAGPSVGSPTSVATPRDLPRETIDTSPSTSIERTAIPPPSLGHPLEMRVLVVESESGRPIAGAEVRAASMGRRERFDPHLRERNPEEDDLLARAETTGITDEHGEARVSVESLPAFVAARLGDRWGAARILGHSAETVRIELDVDRDLAIQVVDAAGNPVSGVPVGLGYCPDEGLSHDGWTGFTHGPDGMVRVRHVQFHLATMHTRRARAHLRILAHDLEQAPFDLDSVPKEPIRLRLPPTGSVEISLFDARREPVLSRSLVLGEGSGIGPDGCPLGSVGPELEADVVAEGRALYAHVGLDLDLVAFATVPGYASKGAHGLGPRAAGERATIELDLGTGTFVLARLVDESGAALANRTIVTDLRTAPVGASSTSYGDSSREWGTSDSRGRIRTPLHAKPAADLRWRIAIRVDAIGMLAGGIARRTLPADLHEGDNDLGDVRVETAKIVLAGSVVDDLGRPVPNALIGVEIEREPAQNPVWELAGDLGGECDAQGEFVVRGEMPDAKLRVTARRIGHARGDPVDAEPGQRDVAIVLPRSSRLAGSLLLDESTRSSRWTVAIKRDRDANASPRELDSDSAVVRSDGSFELDGQRSGTVAVEVAIEVSNATVPMPLPVVDRVDRVELRPGDETRDARLRNLDLRHVRLLRIDVVDENDRPVPSGRLWCADSDPSARSAYSFSNGSVLVLARSPAVELDIRAPGFRSAHLRDVAGDRRVRLDRGLAVRVRALTSARSDPAPLELGLKARRIEADGDAFAALDKSASRLPQDLVEAWLDQGECRMRFPSAGAYELSWMVRKTDRPAGARTELANAHPQRILVIDASTEQVFDAAPDPVELSQAESDF